MNYCQWIQYSLPESCLWYFAINKQGLIVKCYSTTKKEFLYDLGYKKLSQKLQLETSFDSGSGFNYYFGHGSLTNNVKHEITNHYHSNKDVSILIRPVDVVLNDNSDLQIPTDLFLGGKKIKRIIGYKLIPGSLIRKTVSTGLYIENKTAEPVTIKLPTFNRRKDNFTARGSYFRCELGDTFFIKLNFDFLNKRNKNESVVTNFDIFDEHNKPLFKSEDSLQKFKKNNYVETTITIPNLKGQERGARKYIRFSFKLKEFPVEFIVNKIELSKKVFGVDRSELEVNGIKHTVPINKPMRLTMKDFQKHERASIKYIGKTPVSCIIKIQDVLWQVRNAISQFKNNSLELIEYRHQFQKIKEVIITPTKNHKFYLNKVTDIMPLRVEYNAKYINIQLFKINTHSKLSFVMQSPPKKVTGASKILTNKNMLIIIPEINNIQIWL